MEVLVYLLNIKKYSTYQKKQVIRTKTALQF